jgi:hypothetical protein
MDGSVRRGDSRLHSAVQEQRRARAEGWAGAQQEEHRFGDIFRAAGAIEAIVLDVVSAQVANQDVRRDRPSRLLGAPDPT